MLAIVIPARNEPLLAWTIRNIWRTADVCVHVVIVDDGGEPDAVPRQLAEIIGECPLGCTVKIVRNRIPIGVGRSRHAGIMDAPCDAVLILDAHMDFYSSTWASDMVAFIAAHQTAIAGTRCARLAPDRLDIRDSTGTHDAGAWIQQRQIDRYGNQRILQGVWSRNPEAIAAIRAGQPARISCFMGAAYLLSRRHYLFNLRGPWRFMRAWGNGEPVICMVQAALGYETWQLPILVGHVFRTGEGDVPYKTSDGERRYNQFLAAQIAYHRSPERLALANAFLADRPFGEDGDYIAHELETSGAIEFCDWLHAAAKVDLPEWLNRQTEATK